ncbi:MAG: hypothetical protein JSU70_20260 [Phycisphaerales bacterium]|nr:MAG: hypothetical protein JSU70_20260 [Phycisphaerales bacterium]
MSEARSARIRWTASVLVTVCVVTSSARAKYGGGTGEPNDPYLIYTAEQLNAIGAQPNDWDRHFKLMADIDLAELAGASFNIIRLDRDHPFTGVFDGNGHKIRNFTYDSDDTFYIGLFGYVDDENAEVKNLSLIDPSVDAAAAANVGALVGRLGEGSISGCHVDGGNVNGRSGVGGLVGYIHWGTVTQCSSTAAVTGYSTVGGLAGSDHGASIMNSCSTGSVTGERSVGGFVGSNMAFSYITDCYATGDVTGNRNVAGFAGHNSCREARRGTIRCCYSVGKVTGTEYVGGIVGWNCGAVESSFWDIQTSGIDEPDYGEGRTTAQMQDPDTFRAAGWDFVGPADGASDIWAIPADGGYPILWWQLLSPPKPDFLIVDDFEDYNDYSPHRIFQTWIDGWGYTEPPPGHPGNGTGSTVGFWPWIGYNPFGRSSKQCMPIDYDNSSKPYYSETDRTWETPQDWTIHGVDTLTLYVLGEADNDRQSLYVALEDCAGRIAVVVHPDPNAILSEKWIEWNVPLRDFTCVNPAVITKMYIGIGNRDDPIPGGQGRIHIDDIRITKTPPPPEPKRTVVDDFESYDDFCNRIFFTWLDGFGHAGDPDCGVAPFVGNNTGSFVGYMYVPYVEQYIAHNGLQSMPLLYDNDGTVFEGTRNERTGTLLYSEVERAWQTPQDWTIDNADTLAMYVLGLADNDRERLYVAIEDGTGQVAVVPNPDPDAVLVDEWTEWKISFSEFTDVNPAVVTRMYIGLGNRDDPVTGGEGRIFIDDIHITKVPPPPEPDFIVVDDFEDYNDEESHRVFDTWKDGWDDPNNGSEVGCNWPVRPCPNIAHGGRQSMPFYYDNRTADYSQATAGTADLGIGQDWARYGVNTLTLWFRGSQGNSGTEKMYIKLNGSKVAYDGDTADLKRERWRRWSIDLASFGADRDGVTEVGIGFERSGDVGGTGVVYFDDIRLLIWRFVTGDFNRDNDIDFDDFCILAERWLQADGSFLCRDGTDLTSDGLVDYEDLMAFAERWLGPAVP